MIKLTALGRWMDRKVTITDFESERINDFHRTFGGKHLALVRGHNDSDVVLIRDEPSQ